MPGAYGPGMGGRGSAQAAPASAQLGMPQGGVLPTQEPSSADQLSEIIRMLRGGQAGAEKFMQLLSLLAGSTVPQMDQAPQTPPMQGPGDIAGLLGG